MVHPAHASVAYPAVVAHRRLECLALAAHAVAGRLLPLLLLRHGRPGHRPRVRERRLGVARERHGAEEGVHHAQDGADPLGHGEERDGHGRVGHQEPDQRGHDRPGLVAGVHPYPVVLGRPEREVPRRVVVRVYVVLPAGSYPGNGVGRSRVDAVVEVLGRLDAARAAERIDAGPDHRPEGGWRLLRYRHHLYSVPRLRFADCR